MVVTVPPGVTDPLQPKVQLMRRDFLPPPHPAPTSPCLCPFTKEGSSAPETTVGEGGQAADSSDTHGLNPYMGGEIRGRGWKLSQEDWSSWFSSGGPSILGLKRLEWEVVGQCPQPLTLGYCAVLIFQTLGLLRSPFRNRL